MVMMIVMLMMMVMLTCALQQNSATATSTAKERPQRSTWQKERNFNTDRKRCSRSRSRSHNDIYLFASHGMIIIGFTEELRSSTYNQVLQKCLKCDRCKFTFFLQSRNDQVIKMITNKEECSSAIKLTTKTPPMFTTLRADALVGSMSVFGHTWYFGLVLKDQL